MDSLKQIVQELFKNTSIKAVSIGVSVNGASFTDHYGELDDGKNNSPSDKTIYEIGSLTKTFTVTLAAMAILDGKLSLEDNVRKFLPKEYTNLSFKGEPIKVKHLLTHTSGLPANHKGFEEIPAGLDFTGIARKIAEIETKQSKETFFQYLQEIKIDTIPGIG